MSHLPPPAVPGGVAPKFGSAVLHGGVAATIAGVALHCATTLLFLAFLDFLAFFFREEFLAFLSVFPFFPRNFKG